MIQFENDCNAETNHDGRPDRTLLDGLLRSVLETGWPLTHNVKPLEVDELPVVEDELLLLDDDDELPLLLDDEARSLKTNPRTRSPSSTNPWTSWSWSWWWWLAAVSAVVVVVVVVGGGVRV